ncbi:macrosialin-like isoform X1 [Echeneis naucrates]|uniref:Macrosialin-like n=1 Tax=Echeneis naucrates TaxID=173247 RepID=A0A665VBF7_ECHNA|nr:macrosialin-like isoform X1 [Echeneis naucrates]
MKKAVVLFVVACCAVSVLSLAEEKPSATMSSAKQFDVSPSSTTSQPKTTTAMANTTTTTSKTTTTTPKTTTTTPKTTTTTPKTTTTTPKTTTTTPKTTTTTPKTTTTTPKTTATTPKTTTTPVPGPTPPTRVFVGSYNLTEKKVVCLRANMALEIQLSAAKVNGSFIVQPNETKTEGSCGETKANLTLVFKEGFITFMFNKSVADNTAYVDALSFKLSYSFAKGEARQEYRADNKSLHLFAAKVSHCYSCSGEMLYMGNGLYLNVTKNRMQAFNLTKSYDFGQPDMCLADKTDYRVAIGVGVTLLVLIVIVVLAYLVSRRKRTDGYQTL